MHAHVCFSNIRWKKGIKLMLFKFIIINKTLTIGKVNSIKRAER
jgi:hypothetical protein